MGSARFLLMLAVVPALIAASDAIPVKPANEPAVSNEISTDRPDFTESTAVVGPGMVQVESGGTLDKEGGSHSFSGPEVLMRIGSQIRGKLGSAEQRPNDLSGCFQS